MTSKDHLQSKVIKVLSSNSRVSTDSRDFLSCLTTLSTFYGDQNDSESNRRRSIHRTRANLRSMLQRRSVNTNRLLVDAFLSVKKELLAVEEIVSILNNECEVVGKQLQSNRRAIHSLLHKSKQLQSNKETVERRTEIVSKFLEEFQLTNDEYKILHADEITHEFFDVLKRMVTIRHNCRELLQSYHHRVGLDIIDSLGKSLENAYERLYFWLQRQSQNMSDDNPELSPLFVKAFCFLQKSPAYFQHCLQEMYQSRRILLIRRFINALTKGSGAMRPIEIHAHDPVRYISDMLAWIHQVAASERELCMALVEGIENNDAIANNTENNSTLSQDHSQLVNNSNNSNNSNNNDNNNNKSSDSQLDNKDEVNNHKKLQNNNDFDDKDKTHLDAQSTANDIRTKFLGNVFQGICRPLKARIEEALIALMDPLICFQIYNVISFYNQTMKKILPTCEFLQTLNLLHRTSKNQFELTLRGQTARMINSPPPISSDLSVSRLVMEYLTQLKNIMNVFKTSLLPMQGGDFTPILNLAMEPLEQIILLSKKQLDETDNIIYSLNHWLAIQTVMKEFTSFVSTRTETISFEIKTLVGQLIKLQAQRCLNDCGILNIFQLIEEYKDKSIPLSSINGCEQHLIEPIIIKFYNWILSGPVLIHHVDYINNAHLRLIIKNGVAEYISKRYKELYNIMLSSNSGYQNPENILKHTPENLDMLFNG